MYLLVDFSNAARKAFTQIKKAELLGGMGKILSKVDTPLIKNKIMLKQLESKKDNVDVTKIKRLTASINRLRSNLESPTRSYTDAAQIARRGFITPIKSKSYIDRAGYITNPQDNTLLAGVINKIDSKTRATGREYGTRLYKDGRKLKTQKIVEGTDTAIELPKRTKDDVINIHSHPSALRKSASKRDKAISVIPSPNDMLYTNSKETALIVSPQSNNKRTITKYTDGIVADTDRQTLKKYRQRMRNNDYNANYTVITPNKNQ